MRKEINRLTESSRCCRIILQSRLRLFYAEQPVGFNRSSYRLSKQLAVGLLFEGAKSSVNCWAKRLSQLMHDTTTVKSSYSTFYILIVIPARKIKRRFDWQCMHLCAVCPVVVRIRSGLDICAVQDERQIILQSADNDVPLNFCCIYCLIVVNQTYMQNCSLGLFFSIRTMLPNFLEYCSVVLLKF